MANHVFLKVDNARGCLISIGALINPLLLTPPRDGYQWVARRFSSLTAMRIFQRLDSGWLMVTPTHGLGHEKQPEID